MLYLKVKIKQVSIKCHFMFKINKIILITIVPRMFFYDMQLL